MSRKERAERISSHKSKCFPMLAPRAEQELAARHSGLNLPHPDWFQEQRFTQDRTGTVEEGKSWFFELQTPCETCVSP